MRTLYRNAHVISPGVDIVGGSVLVTDGRISQVTMPSMTLPSADAEIDCGGLMLLPGFIDVHAHGRSGVDFTDPDPSAIVTMTRDKRKDGVTSLLVTTLTLSFEELEVCCKNAAAVMNDPEADGARILGMHLEGPYINPTKAGAQNPNFLRNPDFLEVMALNAICPIRKVTFAPELPGAMDFAQRLRGAGIVPSVSHSEADYETMLEALRNGVRDFSHFCNTITPMHHLAFGAVGAGLEIDDFNLELIGDKFHIQPPMLRFIFKVKNIERLQLITDAMRASGLGDGPSVLGGLEVIVKDGIARVASTGAVAGSTLLYNQGLKNLYEVTGLPLKELVKVTSWNQARTLGFPDLGRIEPGYRADFVLMDKNFNVKETWIAKDCPAP